MSVENPNIQDVGRVRRGARWPERLFVGGSTFAYLLLIGSVVAALRLYGG